MAAEAEPHAANRGASQVRLGPDPGQAGGQVGQEAGSGDRIAVLAAQRQASGVVREFQVGGGAGHGGER